jgi:hypothetical protein
MAQGISHSVSAHRCSLVEAESIYIKELQLLHGAVTFATITSTAVFLALLEPIFAVVDAEDFFLFSCSWLSYGPRSWLVSFLGNGRTAKV